MKRRIKNSKVFSNIKDVGDDGLIELKSGEYASLIEVKAIDLSLSSKQEKIKHHANEHTPLSCTKRNKSYSP